MLVCSRLLNLCMNGRVNFMLRKHCLAFMSNSSPCMCSLVELITLHHC